MVTSGREKKCFMGADMSEPARMLIVFCILIWVMVTWMDGCVRVNVGTHVYVCVKMHQAQHQRFR